jgi:hypothetical protein
MKQVHVECLPDERFVSKLGFTKKQIIHHSRRSLIFKKLRKTKNHLAIVDEDPGSGRDSYEKTIIIVEEFKGIKYYKDNSVNKIFVLKGKLEDWIVDACKQNKIKLSTFKLPERPDDLHDVINYKLDNFGKLIDELIKKRNPGILKLKEWLN